MKKRIVLTGIIGIYAILFILFIYIIFIKPKDSHYYDLSQQGFAGIIDSVLPDYTYDDTLTIAYFEGKIRRSGRLEQCRMTLLQYENEVCTTQYSIEYFSPKDIQLTKQDVSNPEYNQYNINHTVDFLDKQVRRIPLAKQLKELRFKSYTLIFNGTVTLSDAYAVIEGSSEQDFPVLSMKKYLAGEGGVHEGGSALLFRLVDENSLISENVISYKLDTMDQEALVTVKNFTMASDYYIDNNQITFTRDYGETWVKGDISEEDLTATLDYYRTGIEIPEFSYSVPQNTETIAFFFGQYQPLIRISHDNGKTWKTSDPGIDWNGLSPTQRIISFFNEKEGVAALGTSWTMGTGEAKYCLFTTDGGDTWTKRDLPLQTTSKILTGLQFSDMQTGIVSLKSATDTSGLPTLYYTTNQAQTWTEITLPEDNLPEQATYMWTIYSFTCEGGQYKITLGTDAKRYDFTSLNPEGPWIFEETWTATVHTIG